MVSLKKFWGILAILLAVIIFYSPLIFSSKIPVPADTIVGLYSPFRDYFADTYPNGIPFKNFLITDPVRQTYVWKELGVNILQNGNIPLWNPYEMAGKPLLANFQTGIFYPLNILLFIKPLSISWSVFILFQTLLFGIFSYIFLKNLKLSTFAAVLGSLSVIFSGFSIGWLEWGTIVSTGIWLPLILLAIDKTFSSNKRARYVLWFGLFTSGLVCSFFAGHLQIFTYLYLAVTAYFIVRWFEGKRDSRILLMFIISNAFFIFATMIQWVPTLQFILLSARDTDQNFRTIEGWFIPWRHLIQFVVPDFFGNPATLNYWGTWNYGELVGFIGVIPLIISSFAFVKKNSTVIFFAIAAFIGLLFALPTGISSLPFLLHIPFVSTAQPTRLLFLVTFSLSVLSAFGFQNLISARKLTTKFIIPIVLWCGVFIILWIMTISKSNFIFSGSDTIITAKRNLLFPTGVFFAGVVLILLYLFLKRKIFRKTILIFIIFIAFFDLFRFAQKFTPFTNPRYLFPSTRTLDFLQSRPGLFRVAVLDRRIMPPNFFTHYKIQTVEGYDPLYLKNYAEFIAILERGKPDISQPFGFNRIITPHNYNSKLFDFLNVKYILSFEEIKSPKLTKVFEEGQTKVYENNAVFERVYFVKKVIFAADDMSDIFINDLKENAIISPPVQNVPSLTFGQVTNINYSENQISLTTINEGTGFLVISDSYYPTWKAYIDGRRAPIYLTNHAFRGIFVPGGKHEVQFKDSFL